MKEEGTGNISLNVFGLVAKALKSPGDNMRYIYQLRKQAGRICLHLHICERTVVCANDKSYFCSYSSCLNATFKIPESLMAVDIKRHDAWYGNLVLSSSAYLNTFILPCLSMIASLSLERCIG